MQTHKHTHTHTHKTQRTQHAQMKPRTQNTHDVITELANNYYALTHDQK